MTDSNHAMNSMHLWSTPKRVCGVSISVVSSWLKFIFCVVLSFYTNTDYDFCGSSRYKHCSSSTTADICSRSSITGSVSVTAEPNCEMTMSANSVCASWFMFTFSVILANSLHFIYQLYCYRLKDGFDPIYDVYLAIEKDKWDLLWNYGIRYKITVISFLELWVISVSWSAINVGVLCGNAFKRRDDSIAAFNFALAMMAVEIYKINVALCLKHWSRIRYYSLLYLTRIDLTVVNSFVILVHGVAFVVFVVWDVILICLRLTGLSFFKEESTVGRTVSEDDKGSIEL